MIHRLRGRVAREAAVAVLLVIGSAATFLRDVQVGRLIPDKEAVRYLATIAVLGALSNVLSLWAIASDWSLSRRLYLPVVAAVVVAGIVEFGGSGLHNSVVSLSVSTLACCCFQVIVNLALAKGARSKGLLGLLVVGVGGPLVVPIVLSVGVLSSDSPSRFVFGIAVYLGIQAIVAVHLVLPPTTRVERPARAYWIIGWSIAMQLAAMAGRLITTRDPASGVAILGAHAWTAVLAVTAMASLFLWRAGMPGAPASRRFLRLSLGSFLVFPVVASGVILLGFALRDQIGALVGVQLSALTYFQAIWPPIVAFVPLLIMSFFVRTGRPDYFRSTAVRCWVVVCLAALGFVVVGRGLGRWANLVVSAMLVTGALASFSAVRRDASRERSAAVVEP